MSMMFLNSYHRLRDISDTVDLIPHSLERILIHCTHRLPIFYIADKARQRYCGPVHQKLCASLGSLWNSGVTRRLIVDSSHGRNVLGVKPTARGYYDSDTSSGQVSAAHERAMQRRTRGLRGAESQATEIARLNKRPGVSNPRKH